MDPERPPQQEAEETIVRLPVDEHLFDRANSLAPILSDVKRQRLFYDCISSGREGALKYATWAFEHITDDEVPALDERSAEEVKITPSHGLKETLQNVAGALHLVGYGVERYEDTKEFNWRLEVAALRYAKQTVAAFQEELQRAKDPSVAAAELGVRDPQLLMKLSDVMSKLPDTVPEKFRKNEQ
jgi:hypothetical protein